MKTPNLIGFSVIQLAMEDLISVKPDMEDLEALDICLNKIFSAAEKINEQLIQNESILDKSIQSALIQDNVIEKNNTSMEEVREYNSKGAGFIVSDATSVSEWLIKSLNHIDERAEDYIDKAAEMTEVFRKLRVNKIDGVFNYRSIMRNLSIGNKVEPERIGVELDKFLTKIHAILKVGTGAEFEKLITLLEEFEVTGNDDNNKLEAIYQASRVYYKHILPFQQKNKIYDLEIPSGRELWIDKTIYLGGKLFYSMTPTQLSKTPGGLWSGFIRVTKSDLDLKAEVPYLTKTQSLEVLKVLQRHAGVFSEAKSYQHTTKQLLEVVKHLNGKYEAIRRQRKLSPRPYILLMNLAVSHLYGIQVKAIGQAEGVYKAGLKYVEKSLKAMNDKIKE